jgi:hypothetical protein
VQGVLPDHAGGFPNVQDPRKYLRGGNADHDAVHDALGRGVLSKTDPGLFAVRKKQGTPNNAISKLFRTMFCLTR